MSTWSSRGLRGSTLEDMVNQTNEQYEQLGLALIQKVPTPITPVRIDKESRHITLAYFEKLSTVDYIGAVQGIPVCFDAKECSVDTFPLQNIHEHQMDFMAKFQKQQGIAFLIIHYSHKNIFYYMQFQEIMVYWQRMKAGGRKSFRFDELNPNYIMSLKNHHFIPYLDFIQKELAESS
ncbi:MAG: Holliday junction resolvase RecU [Lachnospiraceae bacterium]|nr:Holliday junction resolvase RecU [Lachnospiraceae bacterium]